jgi:hypothetical protein
MSDIFSDKIMAMWAIWTFRSRSKVALPDILDSKTNSKYYFEHVQFHFSDRNYESIMFKTIWEWHRFTAVIWENDTKSFIFPKLKVISAQNFEGNTTVLCTFCWTWCFFCRRKKWQQQWQPFCFQNGHQYDNYSLKV